MSLRFRSLRSASWTDLRIKASRLRANVWSNRAALFPLGLISAPALAAANGKYDIPSSAIVLETLNLEALFFLFSPLNSSSESLSNASSFPSSSSSSLGCNNSSSAKFVHSIAFLLVNRLICIGHANEYVLVLNAHLSSCAQIKW